MGLPLPPRGPGRCRCFLKYYDELTRFPRLLPRREAESYTTRRKQQLVRPTLIAYTLHLTVVLGSGGTSDNTARIHPRVRAVHHCWGTLALRSPIARIRSVCLLLYSQSRRTLPVYVESLIATTVNIRRCSFAHGSSSPSESCGKPEPTLPSCPFSLFTPHQHDRMSRGHPPLAEASTPFETYRNGANVPPVPWRKLTPLLGRLATRR